MFFFLETKKILPQTFWNVVPFKTLCKIISCGTASCNSHVLNGFFFYAYLAEQLVYLHGFDGDYPEYEYRLRVKAGLTGFAQIEGKYNTTNKEKLMLDLMYIQSYSLWLDLKLLLQTVLVMLKEDSTEGF